MEGRLDFKVSPWKGRLDFKVSPSYRSKRKYSTKMTPSVRRERGDYFPSTARRDSYRREKDYKGRKAQKKGLLSC